MVQHTTTIHICNCKDYYRELATVDDLKNFFKKLNRKQKRGPVKTACTTKGPAVTVSTYYIQRTIPLIIIGGSPWGQKGPAVNKVDDPYNDNVK